MDENGFRPCRECGKKALIELGGGAGRVCAACFVWRRRQAGTLAYLTAVRSRPSVAEHAKKARR